MEDNWRRGTKQNQNNTDGTTADNQSNNITTDVNGKPIKVDKEKAKAMADPEERKKIYLADIPTTPEQIAISKKKQMEAYYKLGLAYKENLQDDKNAVFYFEAGINKFEDNPYKLETYYNLYRLHNAARREIQAETYKNKILTEFPNSVFAKIIKDPSTSTSKSADVESAYETAYNSYKQGNYEQTIALADEGLTKYLLGSYPVKFAMLKALAIGQGKNIDNYKAALKQVATNYPSDATTEKAKQMLLILETTKKVNLTKEEAKPELYTYSEKGDHLFIFTYENN